MRPSRLSATEPRTRRRRPRSALHVVLLAPRVPLRVKSRPRPTPGRIVVLLAVEPRPELSSSEAPSAAVLPSPLSAEREPNQSLAPLFEALRNACWDHVPSSAHEDVCRTRRRIVGPSRCRILGVDASRKTILVERAGQQRIPVVAQRDHDAERVAGLGVGGVDVGLLRPRGSRARKHVDRARAAPHVVRWRR